jgi:hypothetical protein
MQTPWDGQIFCFLGDVLQDTAVTVAIPGAAFSITPQVYIHDDEA